MNQAFLPKKYASCFFLPGDARFHVKHCLFPPPEKSFLSNPDALPVRTGPRTAIRARSCFRPYNAEKKALPVPGNVPQNAVLSHLLIPVKQIKQAFCHAAFIL